MNDEFYMRRALEEAAKALAEGEFPVGCVVADERKIVARGKRKFSKGDFTNEIDHAEMIALRRLAALGKKVNPRKITIFCTLEPCLMCLGAIILSGIRHVVFAYEDVMGGSTQCDLTQLAPLYKHRQISITPNILRAESLKLFQAYFSDPDNGYWKNSLLARYTLRQ